MNEESSDVNETISEGDVNFSEEIDSLEAEQTSQDKPVEDVVTTKKQTEVNVSSEFVTIKATATGCPQKMRHIFLFISPSVLMLQFYALCGKLQDVLPFVLHIGTGLTDKRFLRNSGSSFDYQIQWFKQTHYIHKIIIYLV